jgi:hypothetical protein
MAGTACTAETQKPSPKAIAADNPDLLIDNFAPDNFNVINLLYTQRLEAQKNPVNARLHYYR